MDDISFIKCLREIWKIFARINFRAPSDLTVQKSDIWQQKRKTKIKCENSHTDLLSLSRLLIFAHLQIWQFWKLDIQKRNEKGKNVEIFTRIHFRARDWKIRHALFISFYRINLIRINEAQISESCWGSISKH